MSDQQPPQWERQLIEKVSLAAATEQRRSRRWGIFFKLLIFIYLFATLAIFVASSELMESETGDSEIVAQVAVTGVISEEGEANAATITKGLRAAFKDERTKAVVLRINSPGGSPVQSDIVYREIKRLREKHSEIPVYAVILDTGASGAYYIAAAADEIYVNPSSIVGSIGVLMNGFGFTETMQKIGVERRLLTAGEHKGGLDPFSPLDPEDVAHIKTVLNAIHQEFIAAVEAGRGDKLNKTEDLFNGRFWSGSRSIELGLADAIGDVHTVARDKVGVEKVVDFTPKDDLLTRFADRVGASAASSFSAMLQQQTIQ